MLPPHAALARSPASSPRDGGRARVGRVHGGSRRGARCAREDLVRIVRARDGAGRRERRRRRAALARADARVRGGPHPGPAAAGPPLLRRVLLQQLPARRDRGRCRARRRHARRVRGRGRDRRARGRPGRAPARLFALFALLAAGLVAAGAAIDTGALWWWTVLGCAGSCALVAAIPIARKLAPYLPAPLAKIAAKLPAVRDPQAFAVAIALSVVTQALIAAAGWRLLAALDRSISARRCSSCRSRRRPRSCRSPSAVLARARRSTWRSAGGCSGWPRPMRSRLARPVVRAPRGRRRRRRRADGRATAAGMTVFPRLPWRRGPRINPRWR